MSVAFWLVMVPTLCYAGTALFYFLAGERQWSLVYAGYSLANIGLLWLEMMRTK